MKVGGGANGKGWVDKLHHLDLDGCAGVGVCPLAWADVYSLVEASSANGQGWVDKLHH